MKLTEITTKHKIFLDLDGVMADFDKGICDITGKRCHQLSDKAIWKAVDEAGDFFANLPMMKDAKELWNVVRKHDVEVLTGLPDTYDAESHKEEWVQNNLSKDIKVNVVKSKNKHKFAKENHILIDDRKDLIKQWEEKGGIGILHKNAKQTIEQLNKLGIN